MKKITSFFIVISMVTGLYHMMSTNVKPDGNRITISLEYIQALADGGEEDDENPPNWPPPGQPMPPPDSIPPGVIPIIFYNNN